MRRWRSRRASSRGMRGPDSTCKVHLESSFDAIGTKVDRRCRRHRNRSWNSPRQIRAKQGRKTPAPRCIRRAIKKKKLLKAVMYEIIVDQDVPTQTFIPVSFVRPNRTFDMKQGCLVTDRKQSRCPKGPRFTQRSDSVITMVLAY